MNVPAPDRFQKTAISLMAVLVLLTFVGANIQALLWRSSDFLVSTVLPSAVVTLTNDERTDLQAAPLQRNVTLDEAARIKAEHMAANQYFSHFSPDGISPWYWFDVAGYTYAHAGENLAIHFTDSTAVVDAWMNSPAHRENIIDNRFTEIGVGTARGTFQGYDTVYVVQLFGAPAAVPYQQVATAALAPKANFIERERGVEILQEPIITDDTVIVRTLPIATSSGLAVGSITAANTNAGATPMALATQPGALLQLIYMMLGLAVCTLLVASLIYEARRHHAVQIAYSLALLLGMSGLWYVHSFITGGAVIV